jgi:hypothetical protein
MTTTNEVEGKTSYGLTYKILSYEAIKTDVKRYKIWNSKYCIFNIPFT